MFHSEKEYINLKFVRGCLFTRGIKTPLSEGENYIELLTFIYFK